MRLVVFVAVFSALLSVAFSNKVNQQRQQNCNKPCPKNLRQVCGSDGLTYNNKCAFQVARCTAKKRGQRLLVRYDGECGKPRKTVVKQGVKQLKSGRKRNRKPCPTTFSRCKTLNSSKNAVCGSDNTTYHTFCHFRITKCRVTVAGKSLTMLYKGECGRPKVKRHIVCPIESQCPTRRSPICGDNEVTYRNLCYFLIAKCEARKERKRVKLRYRGECGSPATPKPCPKSCPTNNKPVCGTDGKTYQNGCHLAKAKCLLPKGAKRQFRVRYRGVCGAPSTPKPCLTVRKCRRKRGSPVCGTDGITYPSKCHLRVVKCQAKRKKRSPIDLKHLGKCNGIGK